MTTPNRTHSSIQPRTRLKLTPALMGEILADVDAMTEAEDLEFWASWLLGQTWKQRTQIPSYQQVDWMLLVGAPLIQLIVAAGTPTQTYKALSALGLMDRGAFGTYAATVALTVPVEDPPVVVGVGQVRAVEAWSTAVAEQGAIHVFALDRDGVRLAQHLAVFCDDREAGATRLILLNPRHLPHAFEATELSTAAAAAREAISHTDMNPAVTVGPAFADLRAFAVAALAQ